MALHLLAPLLWCCLCGTSVGEALSSPILQVINCSTSGNYTAVGAYAGYVNQLLASLPVNAVTKNGGFYNGTVGEDEGTIYGLALCPIDYSRADCADCLVAAASLPSLCPGSATVLAMFDRCLVRYSNVDFFGTPEIGVVEALGGDMVRTSATYGQTVAQSLKDRTDEVVLSPRRFAASAGAPYVFVQCTWDLPANECKQCLSVLSANATNLFAIRTEGQRKSFSCTVRYSNTSYMLAPFTAAPASGPTPLGSGDQTTGSSPTDHPSGVSSSKMATVGEVVPAVLLVVVICLAATIWYVCKLRRQRNTKVHVRKFDYSRLSNATRSFSVNERVGAGSFGAVYRGTMVICLAATIWYVCKLRRQHNTKVHVRKFDYSRLSNATRSFSRNERVGAGSFGAVYRGTMVLEGKEEVVAIKKIIDATSDRSRKEFDNEIRIMSPLSHRNIIKLLGWCNERNNLLLVYEMMEKGNLEDHLYPHNGATDSELYRVTVPGTALLLDWPKRHNILIGIASGLVYLHSGCKECVVHRDIKPGNVMLDHAFNAKLCDFGLVTQVRHTQTSRSTNIVCGTPGYIDPVYTTTYRVTEQSDVYSFGILLLEVACGEKPVIIQGTTRNKLVEKVRAYYQKGQILESVNGRLRGKYDTQIKRVLMIGLLCVQPDRHLRPHIRKVMEFLSNSDASLPSIPVANNTLDTISETVAQRPQPHIHNRNTQ